MSTLESSFAVIDCILSNPDYSEIDKCAIRNISDALLSLTKEHLETLKELDKYKELCQQSVDLILKQNEQLDNLSRAYEKDKIDRQS